MPQSNYPITRLPNYSIPIRRLRNQRLTQPLRREPADVVAWLGAVQAQEYAAARWGLALRMPETTTDAMIRRAVDDGRILRTHVMRPTWHFVRPADIRWMLELTAPRVHRYLSTYFRHLELDTETLIRAATIFERAVGKGRSLTRAELGAELARRKLEVKGIRLALMTVYAELEGILCSGPYRGKQLTYTLLANRAPRTPAVSRDEAIGELALRYFRSHGPATIRDFVWWSGLATADARRGVEINRARHVIVDGLTYWSCGADQGRPLHTTGVGAELAPPFRARPARRTRRDDDDASTTVHLLPVYDEYLVAYRDRDAVPYSAGWVRSSPRGQVTFQHTLVIGGQVAGTWRSKGSTVEIIPLRKLNATERRGLEESISRYERFASV